MSEKLISVIVPVYKVEKYLDKCVESIVNQTYKNLEIILVDDGSPDNCPAMCDTWAEKDNRIKVIHKENGGLSDARNAGFAISNGEYISFIDSDDWIDLDFYQLLSSELDKGADIAECASDWCDENGKTISVRGFSEPKILNTVEATQMLLQEKGIMQTVWNKLYKRECVENILFEKSKFHEDNFWTWQTFLKAKKVSIITKPMYHYVQRNSGIMGVGYSLKRLDALEADFKCYETLKNDDNYKQIVANRLVGACMYQMQCAMKYLKGNEKQQAIEIIMIYFSSLNKADVRNDISNKWAKAFIIFPKLIAKIRCITGIGF